MQLVVRPSKTGRAAAACVGLAGLLLLAGHLSGCDSRDLNGALADAGSDASQGQPDATADGGGDSHGSALDSLADDADLAGDGADGVETDTDPVGTDGSELDGTEPDVTELDATETGCEPACFDNQTCVGESCECLPGYVPNPIGGDPGCVPDGPGPCGDVACPPYSACGDDGLCHCDGDASPIGAGCWPDAPTDPATRDKSTVCGQWSAGTFVGEKTAWAGAAGSCEPGGLASAAAVDTLARLSLFRWMVGLPPVTEDGALRESSMRCAVVSAYGPPSPTVPNPHDPSANQMCYTEAGADAAGKSNISWGAQHPAQSITNFMEDWDNSATMGHRRWCLYPPLAQVGIGYYKGGGPYGDGMCLQVLQAYGKPADVYPSWYAFPPPGPVPTAVTDWIWTFHSQVNVGEFAQWDVQVVRQSDNKPMPVTLLDQIQGFGDSTVAWEANGWTSAANETYQVTVATSTVGPISYKVTPVNCGK